MRMPLRSVVIRLESGALWVHSPIKFSAAALESIESLGEVTALVAPSGFHHLHVARAQQHFAGAEIWASPAVAPKQPKLGGVHWLGQDPAPAWSDDIEPLCIGGMPKVQEWVFFHRASQTLIVTDLVFNLLETSGLLTPVFLTLFGTRGRFAQSRLFKAMIKDREAYDSSISRLLEWPVGRVMMAHGTVLEGDDVYERLCRAVGV
jgi:hypothetical protein